MTIQLVNVGNSANDGQGDDLREAFIKVNNSLSFLESISFQEGSNLGSAGAEIYANTENNILNFRRLVAGANISLQQLENSIIITNTQPESRFIVTGDQGSIIAGANLNYNIVGAQAITVEADDNTKTITIRGALVTDPQPALSQNLNGNNKNLTAINEINAQRIVTTLIGNAPYTERLGKYIEQFDAGSINVQINSILDFIVATTPIDFGTIQSPISVNVDMGVGF